MNTEIADLMHSLDTHDITILAAARGVCKKITEEMYRTRSGGAASVVYDSLTQLILTLGISDGVEGYREALGIATEDDLTTPPDPFSRKA